MASISGVLTLLVLLFMAHTARNMYESFRSPRCPSNVAREACYSPLFEEGEEVDLYAYVTSNPKLRWWTKEGFLELRGALLWNSTGEKYGGLRSASVTVPLASETLRGVRQNQSHAHVHLFIARAGADLEAAVLAEARTPDPGPVSSALGNDVVHATGPITRAMPKLETKVHKQLLGQASGSNHSADQDAEDPFAAIERPPVDVFVPKVGWKLQVQPTEALQWTALFAAMSVFSSPSGRMSLLRHALHVGAAWLWKLRQQQNELYQDLLRKRAKNEAELRALQEPTKITPHIVPQIRLVVGVDDQWYDPRHPSPLLYQEFVFDGTSPMPIAERPIRYPLVGSKKTGKRYVLPVAVDLFGFEQRQWVPLSANASVEDPTLRLAMENTGMHRYSLVEMLKQSVRMYLKVGFSETDLEELQQYFFRYPMHVLISMQVIGVLQTLLTTLAFKNDIAFFRGRQDYTGLSSRSLGTDVLQDIVIFLYLYDLTGISRIVLAQVGIGAAISAWKYVRVARLKLRWSNALPWVTHNRGLALEGEKDTEDIDAKGMNMLMWVLYPLSIAWGIWCLQTYHYSSWWSWGVSTAANFAYTFGFINMMPQIFINYKLKSVAHMPWRVLMYKFFHTFIDDVFAWFILPKEYMSTKHRMMTLRDDIVFFVFLYQRWIYKVDHNRPDEFGFVYADGVPPDACTDGSAAPRTLPASDNSKAAALKGNDGNDPVLAKDSPPEHEVGRMTASGGPLPSDHADADDSEGGSSSGSGSGSGSGEDAMGPTETMLPDGSVVNPTAEMALRQRRMMQSPPGHTSGRDGTEG